MPKQKLKEIQSVRGMHDILPVDQHYWQFILKKAGILLDDYSFEKIDTPIVEDTTLFVRTVGEATDIVEKEMYSFETKGGEEISLRPELTAPVVRSYIEHGMSVMPHPVKLWYLGPVFRHDNPQAGRLRQFYQLGIETFGDDHAAADVEVILAAYNVISVLGLKNLIIQINSIGDQNCRPQYIKALKNYYSNKSKKICPKCASRLKKNILRLLDCNEAMCKETLKDAPQILDYLDDDCKKHFKTVLEFLDELKLPYILNPYLVRGLDYYTRTVFEIWPEEKPEGDSGYFGQILSGGRYDKLVEVLGGPATPAVGWAMGMERAILLLKENNINVPESKAKPKVFMIQLGDTAKKKSFILFEEVRKSGIPIKATFGRDSIKSQLRIANRLGVKYALIIGQKEALEDAVIAREMNTGAQETVPISKIVDFLKPRLKS